MGYSATYQSQKRKALLAQLQKMNDEVEDVTPMQASQIRRRLRTGDTIEHIILVYGFSAGTVRLILQERKSP